MNKNKKIGVAALVGAIIVLAIGGFLLYISCRPGKVM
jgi:hypothetical protein